MLMVVFLCSILKKKLLKKRKISCRLRIEQRMIDPVTNNSGLGTLDEIAAPQLPQDQLYFFIVIY